MDEIHVLILLLYWLFGSIAIINELLEWQGYVTIPELLMTATIYWIGGPPYLLLKFVMWALVYRRISE